MQTLPNLCIRENLIIFVGFTGQSKCKFYRMELIQLDQMKWDYELLICKLYSLSENLLNSWYLLHEND